MVRAKFTVKSIARDFYPKSIKLDDGSYKSEPRELHTVTLTPVYGNGDPNHENTKFWEASPTGEIKLGTINAEAASQFELGKEYYIDFTKAE